MDSVKKHRRHGTSVPEEKPKKNGPGSTHSHKRTGSIQGSKRTGQDISLRGDKERHRPRKVTPRDPILEFLGLYKDKQNREYTP